MHGLREPIVLFEGAILDGRNRARACQAAQVAARYKTYDGRDPLAFVVSANLHRRHLDVSQRSMIAARISERQTGLRRSGPSQKLGGKLAKRPRPERYKPRQDAALSGKEAARLMNVSEASVSAARKVIERGIESLKRSVDQGDISVDAAVTVAAFDPKRQQQIIDAGSKTVTIIARTQKEAHKASPQKYQRVDVIASAYNLFRVGDGRGIGSVRLSEAQGLARTLRICARVLELIGDHVAYASGGSSVREAVTVAKLDEFIVRATAEIEPPFEAIEQSES